MDQAEARIEIARAKSLVATGFISGRTNTPDGEWVLYHLEKGSRSTGVGVFISYQNAEFAVAVEYREAGRITAIKLMRMTPHDPLIMTFARVRNQYAIEYLLSQPYEFLVCNDITAYYRYLDDHLEKAGSFRFLQAGELNPFLIP